MNGVSVGIMQPDRRPVVYEARCPKCWNLVRELATGAVGVDDWLQVTCRCGATFDVELIGKEFDS